MWSLLELHDANSRAVLAERLRRTLKARVRKSVDSIPTDCKYQLFCTYYFAAWRGFFFTAHSFVAIRPGIAQLAERETVAGYN